MFYCKDCGKPICTDETIAAVSKLFGETAKVEIAGRSLERSIEMASSDVRAIAHTPTVEELLCILPMAAALLWPARGR